MNKTETAKLLAAFSAFYQNFQVNSLSVELWADLFSEVNYQDAMKALKVFTFTNSAFAPSPGQLITIIKEQKEGIDPPADLAFEEAINFLYGNSKIKLHPRIAEVLEYVDLSPFAPRKPYNPHGMHIEARDERFMQQEAKRSFIRAYTEGVKYEKKRHSRELSAPEKKTLSDVFSKVREIN